MLGSSSRMIVVPWLALKTMLGFSQHHHHQGKISRMRASLNLEEIREVRALLGWSSPTARKPAKPTPVMRSAVLGLLSGATWESATGADLAECKGRRRSRCSITASMSNSHHHGQQNHQLGQHGHQQNREVHQLKLAVKLPSELVGTVARGVLIKPLTPMVT